MQFKDNINNMESIFTNVYETHEWGTNNKTEYNGSSGGGSEINFNKNNYVPFLRNLIIDNTINTIVDLGCGDFRCGHILYDDLDITYTGYDAYKKVIDYNSTQYPLPKYTFTHLDFCNNKESIVGGDLCILKDVLQHWSLDNIYNFLDYLVEQKKFKYIVICNCDYQTQDNTDIQTGKFRPLSCRFLPLRKYNPTKVYNYNTKEVSVITLNNIMPIIAPVPTPAPRQDVQLVDIPVTDDNVAFNIIVSLSALAQRRGAFNIQETAKLSECIQRFTQTPK